MVTRMTGFPRFWSKVDDDGPTAPGMSSRCHVWTAADNGAGYGVLKLNGRMVLAHRLAYELLVGPIPTGLQIDHLCRNRRCVNVEHLEPVTHRENALRGVGASARNALKTHCPLGHAYAGSNLYVQPGTGARECRTCWRLRRLSRSRA